MGRNCPSSEQTGFLHHLLMYHFWISHNQGKPHAHGFVLGAGTHQPQEVICRAQSQVIGQDQIHRRETPSSESWQDCCWELSCGCLSCQASSGMAQSKPGSEAGALDTIANRTQGKSELPPLLAHIGFMLLLRASDCSGPAPGEPPFTRSAGSVATWLPVTLQTDCQHHLLCQLLGLPSGQAHQL